MPKWCMLDWVSPVLRELELAHAKVEIADEQHVQVLKEGLVRQQNIGRELLSLLQERSFDLPESLPSC